MIKFRIVSARLAFAAVLLGAAAMSPARAQDATAGEKVFKSQCSICHTVAAGKNLVGPSLFPIVGRKAGQVPGFRYSAANRDSALTWDQATLDRYLLNPRAAVPGTTMTFTGVKSDEQRRDLIAYLASVR